MCCGPLCIAIAQGIPSALVALTVGIAGWVIARHQARVAQAKLKLDLFEKRYPIFLKTWKIMSEVATKGTRERSYGLGNPFSNFKPKARFLFGEDIDTYLSEAINKWVTLDAFEAEKDDPALAAQHAAQKKELKAWFFQQASTGVRDLFAPYLDFEKWK